jgi:hypothetical protein
MSIIPNNIINAYKKTVDTLALTQEADNLYYASLSLQHKCLFNILLYPDSESFLNILNPFSTTASDFIVSRYFIYAINDIPLLGFEYQRFGGFQTVKDTIYPDQFSITFIEDELGKMKGYFRKWIDEITTYIPSKGIYVFKDNQLASKKTAIIMPNSTDTLPGTEWVKITGMKPKNITGIGYDHASSEHELITVEFTCDNIRLVG